MNTCMSAEEMKWRRRSDARTLAEAEAIKSDKKRYADAITGAKEIAQEELTKVNSILKVSKIAYPKGVETSSRRNNPATLGSL